MTWQMVGEDFIRLSGSVSKTGKGRLVPVLDNLKLWLAPLRQKADLVVPSMVSAKNAPAKLAKAAGVAWIDDGLRHSFGTFRQSILKNIGQVVEEMGNTAQVCRKHYLNPLVLPEVGLAWFAIKPDGTEKITQLPEQATA